MEKPKRGQGEGSIDWRNGRARVRLRMPDGSRKPFRAPPDVTTDEQAEAFRRALLAKLAGTASDPKMGGATLGAWGVQWLEQRARTHADHEGDAQRWTYVAGTPIAAMKLSAITPADLRRWAKATLERRTERGTVIDRGTVRNAWTTIRAAIRAAGELDPPLLDSAPLLAVELPRGTLAQHVELEEAIDVLALDEIDAVLALDLTPEQRSAFVVGLFTALRAGELHGLTWERLVLEGQRPEVVVARSRKKSTKAGTVKRVPLFEPARKVLFDRWIAKGRPSSGLVWPSVKQTKDGAILLGCHARGFDWGWSSTRERKPIASLKTIEARAAKGELRIVALERRVDPKRFEPAHARDATHVLIEWPGIRERAGIRRPVTWKDATRHTCASHLLMGSWVPSIVPQPYRLEEVSRMLRHSSIAVTERYYARFMIDALPGAVRKGPAVGPVGPGTAKIQAASGSRTPDLRFTKTALAVEDHSGIAGPGTHGSSALRALETGAAGLLEAIAAGDRFALRKAVDLALGVLELARGEGVELEQPGATVVPIRRR